MTALDERRASRRGAPFIIIFDRVAVSREAVGGVITCLQEFLRDPFFTQKSSFSDYNIAMLKDAVAVAERVVVSEEFNPLSVFEDGFNQQVVSDLQLYREKVVLRRQASLDTSERWL